MLTAANNELLTRVGPGTPMGDLMRQYWMPACLSSELIARRRAAARSCCSARTSSPSATRPAASASAAEPLPAPRRLDVLRTQRRRRPALRLPRLEVRRRRQLRRHAHRARRDQTSRARSGPVAYPCQERGGIVWTYMGPRTDAAAAARPRGQHAARRASTACVVHCASATGCRRSKATSTPSTPASCTTASVRVQRSPTRRRSTDYPIKDRSAEAIRS